MKILENYDLLRGIYAEIIVEKTPCPELGGYIKHFTDLEYAELLTKKKRYLDDLIKQGVQTKQDKVSQAIEQETWTLKNEDDLLSLDYVIADNTKLIENMLVADQRQIIQAVVDKKIAERNTLRQRKSEAIGEHAEFFADRYYNEIIPLCSLYEDKTLTKLKHEDADNSLDREELENIRYKYNLALLKFSDRNLRILATMPFLLNVFTQCKNNLLLFLDKPIVHYTLFQSDLVFKCLRNIRILENCEADSPQITDCLNAQELLDFYDLNHSVLQGRNKSGSQNSGVTTSTRVVSTKS